MAGSDPRPATFHFMGSFSVSKDEWGYEMAETKKPADRKPKVETVDGVSTVTIKGITVRVEKDALDDFELLDDLAKMQDGDGARIASVAHRLFGDEFKKVMDGLRGENGRVSVESASEFISELLAAIAPSS